MLSESSFFGRSSTSGDIEVAKENVFLIPAAQPVRLPASSDTYLQASADRFRDAAYLPQQSRTTYCEKKAVNHSLGHGLYKGIVVKGKFAEFLTKEHQGYSVH
jgi:hypothetical protein